MRLTVAAGLLLVAAHGSPAAEKQADDYILEITLTRDVTLPVVVQDRQAGTAVMPAGRTLELVDVTPSEVLVESIGTTTSLPRDATDIDKRVKDADTSGPTRRDLRDAVKYRFVLVGMTPAQVLRAAGPPQRQARDGSVMRWWYPVWGDVPKSTRMTVSRGTPESAPCFIPGGYTFLHDPPRASRDGHFPAHGHGGDPRRHPRGGVDWIIRDPPAFFPGFVGESIQIQHDSVEKAVIGERLLVFEDGRLVQVDEPGPGP